MTSLQASLPASASGLWRMDREYGISQSRVKHIVIHEAHIRDHPDRHVVYRIDVFTTERNWCVYRRYSEFWKLHDKISNNFKMFKGTFPPKVLSGNLTPAVVEERRSALEHYLLKIINCHNIEVATCNTVLRFLDLHRNDVYYVTSGLCRHIKIFGEAILNEEHVFLLSPTQLFCIHKRLRIPNNDFDFKADSIFCDLSSLYDFMGRLTKLCVKPISHQDDNIRTELTILKNLKELQIQNFSVSLIKGLSLIQIQLQKLKVSQSISAMKDILIDSVLEKKAQPKPPKPAESLETPWRTEYNLKAVQNAFTIHPWISLLYLDLVHNNIQHLDDSFSLLPNLQEIDLSFNKIEVLDLNMCNPSLTKIVCVHSGVKKVVTKLHENLNHLVLDDNLLNDLDGFSKLVVLRNLSVRNNNISSVDNIVTLTELPRLHTVSFLGNVLSKQRNYRQTVLCLFTQACRRDDIILDGRGFTEKEKKKAKSTRIKGCTPSGPSSLPFFGSSSDHVPAAFKSNQETASWNSILNEDDSETASELAALSVEAEVPTEEELPLSAEALTDVRSTPSQPRTYDWDPSEAFASSPSSSYKDASIPDIASPAAASYVDYTSSSDDIPQTIKTSKQDDLQSSLKHFNSSYYSLSGSTELYSKSGTSPSSSKTRVNPFGKEVSSEDMAKNYSSAEDLTETDRTTNSLQIETDTVFISCENSEESEKVKKSMSPSESEGEIAIVAAVEAFTPEHDEHGIGVAIQAEYKGVNQEENLHIDVEEDASCTETVQELKASCDETLFGDAASQLQSLTLDITAFNNDNNDVALLSDNTYPDNVTEFEHSSLEKSLGVEKAEDTRALEVTGDVKLIAPEFEIGELPMSSELGSPSGAEEDSREFDSTNVGHEPNMLSPQKRSPELGVKTGYSPSPGEKVNVVLDAEDLVKESRLCSLSLGNENITIDDIYDSSSGDGDSEKISFTNSRLEL